MKVIKKINNNCALCLDSNQHKVVAFGKGIGFRQPPYDVELESIRRIFYDIDEMYINMINDIPEELLELCAKVIDEARKKLDIASSNVVVTLADHLQFAIERNKKKMDISLPVIQDIQYIYDEEMEIGKEALNYLNSHLQEPLPEKEAIYIALHLINSEMMNQKQREKRFNEKMIHKIILLIEKELNIHINRDSYHYSRFVTHFCYLLKGEIRNEMEKDGHELLVSLSKSFPNIYECTMKIKMYLNEHLDLELTDEECVYLMMHIHRLCSRETMKDEIEKKGEVG